MPEGFNRIPHENTWITVSPPVTVYGEGVSEENHFIPSGFMGDFAVQSLTSKRYSGSLSAVNKSDLHYPLDRNCRENPVAGESCLKITYTCGDMGWAGIYWQYPINNWGDYKGYCFKPEPSRLTFWARGSKGGELCSFSVGGISDPDKPIHDSFKAETYNPVELSSEWRQYEIDLEGEKLNQVIGGFCWATNQSCVVYIDEIKFEN